MLTGSVGNASNGGLGMLTALGARRDVSNSVLDWDFGAYFAFTAPSKNANDGRIAEWSWWATGLFGCPVSWPPGPVRLRGCASLEGGLLTRTETFPNSDTDRSKWLAVTVGFQWQWAMLPWLELQLAGSGLFPIWRGTFYVFEPGKGTKVAYQTDSFSVRGTAGLNFVLPL